MKYLKALLLMSAGLFVVPLIDLIENLKDKERLRVANAKRAARGQPPFASLWEYYKTMSREGAEREL